VSLEVIKPGLASEGIIRRFKTGRQTLAIMNHPVIAKIFEGGGQRRSFLCHGVGVRQSDYRIE
jgi:hypothetical protein